MQGEQGITDLGALALLADAPGEHEQIQLKNVPP